MTNAATTISLSWPRHTLTLEEWEALPEDGDLWLELAEGALVTSPQPFMWHQHAARRLAGALGAHLPNTLVALCAVEVMLCDSPPTIRVPDVLVTRTEIFDRNPSRGRATDVYLAVEVLSEGTRRVDRVLKFSEYADAGIGQYWIVDLNEPTTLTAYTLVDGDYELVAEATGAVDLEVAGHRVLLDLATLTRP